MTYAPITLQSLRSYLIGQGAPVLGIVGNPATHKRGYHMGSPLLPGDYSGIQPRDKAGLSGAASAIDIGRFPRLIGLGRHMVRECVTGHEADIRELIAERGNGTHVWRWDRVSGKVTGHLDSDELYHHLHVSYFRDSQSRDKRPPFQRFFSGQLPDTSTGEDVTYRIVTTGLPVSGRLRLRDQDGIHYLRLRDNKLIEVTDRAAFGVKEAILPVRLDKPIVAGKPATDEWRLGYIVGEDAAFVLARNVVIDSPQYVAAVEP